MNTKENIRKYRLERGLTQKKLGELCGIAESTIRKYELGLLNPKKETLEKIAKALNVSMLSLFGVDTAMKERKTAIQEEAETRKIDKIIKSLENIGCSVVFSYFQDEDIPLGLCSIYFNKDNKSIVVTDDELLEIEKTTNDFLKFKLNELINNKEIKETKSVSIGHLHDEINRQQEK